MRQSLDSPVTRGYVMASYNYWIDRICGCGVALADECIVRDLGELHGMGNMDVGGITESFFCVKKNVLFVTTYMKEGGRGG